MKIARCVLSLVFLTFFLFSAQVFALNDKEWELFETMKKEWQFIEAVKNNDLQAIERLYKEGVDINAQDNQKRTALHWASAIGDPERVKVLLELGANLDVRDNLGRTALDLARANRKVKAIVLITKWPSCF